MRSHNFLYITFFMFMLLQKFHVLLYVSFHSLAPKLRTPQLCRYNQTKQKPIEASTFPQSGPVPQTSGKNHSQCCDSFLYRTKELLKYVFGQPAIKSNAGMHKSRAPGSHGEVLYSGVKYIWIFLQAPRILRSPLDCFKLYASLSNVIPIHSTWSIPGNCNKWFLQ